MTKIELAHAGVTFPIFDARSRSLKRTVGRTVRPQSPALVGTGGRLEDANGVVLIEALHDISLTLAQGDRLALIGHNGAGKSTLLRLLAGIYEPTAGRVAVTGRVAPVFDLGVGMDPEISGYENILIRGLFLGMSRQFMQRHVDEIAAFTELGDYLRLPLRSYSTGMRVRLALGVVTVVEPEILLLDEGLGAVDHGFAAKAAARLGEMVSKAGILVFASHSQELLLDLCDTAVRLDAGRVVDHGRTADVLDRYSGHPQTEVARSGEDVDS